MTRAEYRTLIKEHEDKIKELTAEIERIESETNQLLDRELTVPYLGKTLREAYVRSLKSDIHSHEWYISRYEMRMATSAR